MYEKKTCDTCGKEADLFETFFTLFLVRKSMDSERYEEKVERVYCSIECCDKDSKLFRTRIHNKFKYDSHEKKSVLATFASTLFRSLCP